MKVLVLPSWYPPHGGGFFQEQAQALAELGHEVTVLSVERVSPRDTWKWLASLFMLFLPNYSDVQEGPLRVLRAQVPGLPRLLSVYANIFAQKAYRVFIRFQSKCDYQPQIIHVHSLIWAGFAAAKINERTKIPYLVTEHRGRFVNNQYVNAGEKQEMALEQLDIALQGAAKILCVSSILQPYLKSRAPQVNIDVLPNMVDIEHFCATEKSNNQEFHFVCVANIVPLKAHKTLLEAFHQLLNLNHNAMLTIVGDGWHAPEVKAFAQKLGLDESVYFTGHITHDEVKAKLTKADAFVLPSQYEAFGIVYIEAMSMGLPVIATNSGGAIDFVNESNGLLVEPNNSGELSQAMQNLMQNIEQYNRNDIKNYVKENYSKQVIAEKLSVELSALIGKK